MIRVKNISIISPDTPEGKMWAEALEKELRSFRTPASVRGYSRGVEHADANSAQRSAAVRRKKNRWAVQGPVQRCTALWNWPIWQVCLMPCLKN